MRRLGIATLVVALIGVGTLATSGAHAATATAGHPLDCSNWRYTAADEPATLPAEFDRNKPVTLKGSVTRVDWGNPHIWVFIDVKDDTGKVSNWGVEGGAPNGLFRNGWRKDSLKVGDIVTVEGFQGRDGSQRANANRVTLPVGRRVFAGSSIGAK